MSDKLKECAIILVAIGCIIGMIAMGIFASIVITPESAICIESQENSNE